MGSSKFQIPGGGVDRVGRNGLGGPFFISVVLGSALTPTPLPEERRFDEVGRDDAQVVSGSCGGGVLAQQGVDKLCKHMYDIDS
jgi:hypothetical protein